MHSLSSGGWGFPSSGTAHMGGNLAAIAVPSVGNGIYDCLLGTDTST